MPQVLPDQVSSDQNRFISQFAAALCRRGWRLPALVLLEAGQPLAFLGGQLLWLAQPALSLFIPNDSVRRAAQILEDPEAVAMLITQLDTAVSETGDPS